MKEKQKSGRVQDVLSYNREYLFWDEDHWSRKGECWQFSMTNNSLNMIIACFKKPTKETKRLAYGRKYDSYKHICRNSAFYVKDTLTDQIFLVNQDETAEEYQGNEKDFLNLQQILHK